jgi:hypothetical protein
MLMHHGGAKQCNRMLVLALKPCIVVKSIGMSWQRVCLSLKSYVTVDVDDQAITSCHCRVMLAMTLPR